MRKPAAATLAVLLACMAAAAHCAEYYVDPSVGGDDLDGLARVREGEKGGPFKTISRAIKAARAGDTIHLTPSEKPWRQMADFYGCKGGEPDRPIVLDGHGVTLTGADPCPSDGWTVWKDDVLVRTDIRPAVFLMADDRMVFETLDFNVLGPATPFSTGQSPTCPAASVIVTPGAPRPGFAHGSVQGISCYIAFP